MDKSIITLIICVVSIFLCMGSLFFIKQSLNRISKLPKEIISTLEKEENIQNFTKSLYIILGCLAISLINFLFPDGLLKFLIPIIVMVIVGFLLSDIIETLEKYNLKKDDVDIIMESNKKRTEDFKYMKQQMENENKKRKNQEKEE